MQYTKEGFSVSHAAISKENGVTPFVDSDVGTENKGISNNCNKTPESCVNVTMYSLDSYLEKFVPKDVSINYLSVDVEGYDYEVLSGGMDAGSTALKRVQYLEFEYNWMGPWARTPLSVAINNLDRQGFTCYWPGFNRTIWRITKCWLDHYDMHFWSNVACVNRNSVEVQDMAWDMERMFTETMTRSDAIRDYAHRFTEEDWF